MSVNPAQHHRLRRLVSRAFTPRAAERMRAACTEVITELVDRHSTVGRCDMVHDIARQYPVPIICALVGAPPADWELFAGWADDLSKAFGGNVAAEESAILQAWRQLDAYLEDLIARRRQSLGDDLISELIRVEEDGDRLAHDELVNLVAILLNAGTDTTRNQLAAAVQVLSDYPDQWALLAEHPELAPRAVEELMRHSPIIFATVRVATTDVELGRRSHPGGRLRLRQHRGRQPRSRDVRRSRSSRHHPGRPGTDADLRRWGALLPRCPPRQDRARRSFAGHHPANADTPGAPALPPGNPPPGLAVRLRCPSHLTPEIEHTTFAGAYPVRTMESPGPGAAAVG